MLDHHQTSAAQRLAEALMRAAVAALADDHDDDANAVMYPPPDRLSPLCGGIDAARLGLTMAGAQPQRRGATEVWITPCGSPASALVLTVAEIAEALQ